MEDSFTFYSDKLSFAEVKGKEGTEYFVEGHISTEDPDLVDDVVTKGCLDDMYSQFDSKNIKLDFEHEAFRGKSQIESEINKTKMPLGKSCIRTRDTKGVKVKWQLNPVWKKFDAKGNITMDFKELWASIKGGFLDAFSIAYIVKDTTPNQNIKGKNVRLLKRINLLNVALTGNPVNTHATMTNVMVKSLEQITKKGYEKDGAHAHTEDNPLGNHNHPEIEKSISEMYNHIDRRIEWVKEDNNLKSHGGNNMAEKKENNADTKDQKPDETNETKDKPEMVEVKALTKSVSDLTAEVKSVSEIVKDLKGQVEAQDKILSKAQTKALGAEAKGKEAEAAATQTAAPETKSVIKGMI